MPNFHGKISPTILFYKLLQSLHHLSLMKMQQDGRVNKAFTLKLSNLNDLKKRANSTEKIRYNVDQINKAWVSGMTRIRIHHYESSVFLLICFTHWNKLTIQIFRTNTAILTNIINNVKMCKPSSTY